MSNPPIITPNPPTPSFSLQIGSPIAGSTPTDVLYVDASNLLAQDSGLTYNPSVKDLAIGRDVNAGRDLNATRNLTVSGPVANIAPSGNVNANLTVGSSQASVANLILKAANGNQEIITFNSNGDKFGIINNNSNLLFYDWVNSLSLMVLYAAGGVAPTKLTTVQKLALTGVEGMMVYDTTLHKLCVFTGSAWETITSS
jgi:hypothetical protein